LDSTFDEFFMQRCLQLAKLGAEQVAPNPMVGAVLVYRGRIIGEGYHRQYGFAHAEVNCVASVKPEDAPLIPASTMYVSLEPCAHHGKTPPCADLIVAQHIKEVVIGCVDTFSKVAGKGIEILKNAGIQVRTGILEQQCRELNSRFFTFHEQKRPYIILKWAQSSAGYIAPADGKPVRISNAFSDRLVHKWRSEEMGIMIGTNTAIMDNPRLNNRLWTGKNPVRLVIDRHSKIPHNYHLRDNNMPTLFFTEAEIDFAQPILLQITQRLHERNIQSVLVEGGANLLQQFISEGLWDEARIITGTTQISEGLKAPSLTDALLTAEINLEGDRITYYKHIA
jgi:diaminohydroxyphosphoribosylaminopyrimidine deaminase / 5-amino-6-(5-phosphoribosylamino)uracil reductase